MAIVELRAAAQARGDPWPTTGVHLSLQAASGELNRREVRTASGKPWHATQVIRLRDRLGL